MTPLPLVISTQATGIRLLIVLAGSAAASAYSAWRASNVTVLRVMCAPSVLPNYGATLSIPRGPFIRSASTLYDIAYMGTISVMIRRPSRLPPP